MSTDDEEEREHWWNVMRTFLFYSEFVETEVARRQNHLSKLKPAHYNRLPQITFDKLGMLMQAAEVNQGFFDHMVQYHASNSFLAPPEYALSENSDGEIENVYPAKEVGPLINMTQHHRNNAVLHSLYREWSSLGSQEREESMGVLVAELSHRLPVAASSAFSHRVLVPGCGLGRLALEIAAKGYKCEGNEFSAYMAVASNFVLNGITKPGAYEIFPWISNISNIVNVRDTLESVVIPDVTATQLLESYMQTSQDQQGDGDFIPRFSMAAGDFTEIYGTPENASQWDCVVTCFFLDTAPNVLKYIETIFHVLKPGGFWLNLGPLLYHWVADVDNNQDERYTQSIELSYEELKEVIQDYGFAYLLEERRRCSYTRCTSSMMHTVYDAMQFTVQKSA